VRWSSKPRRSLCGVSRLRIALCQLDPVVGDLAANAEAIIADLDRAEDAGADLAVFGELAITGYPPEDLLLKPGFVADNLTQLARPLGRIASQSLFRETSWIFCVLCGSSVETDLLPLEGKAAPGHHGAMSVRAELRQSSSCSESFSL